MCAHVAVLGAEDPIAADRIPAAGPIALLPLESPEDKAKHTKSLEEVLGVVPDGQVQVGLDAVTDETRAVLWFDSSGKGIETLNNVLTKYKNIAWVQLPMAGITHYLPVVQKHGDRLWTSAKGAYSQPVAEHALMLTLALLRYIPMRVHATSWGPSKESTLFNSNVLILGAGGITLSLLSLIAPFTPTVTVLRRKAEPIEDKFIPATLKQSMSYGTLADLDNYVDKADVVIVNCALTDETRKALGKKQFDRMKSNAIVVNVARGEVINIDDLTDALKTGRIFGAGLDVTHPEPLPDSHPLWNLSSSNPDLDAPVEQGGKRANLIITPHVANTAHTSIPLYKERIRRNLEAWVKRTGRFEGIVDAKAGY